MRQPFEILRDPADRYLVWDIEDDAPLVRANRVVTYSTLAETRVVVERLRPAVPACTATVVAFGTRRRPDRS